MLLHTYLFLFHLQLCIVSSGSYIANRHRNWSGALAKSNLIFWLRSAGGERKIRSSRRRCYWFCWCNLRLVFPLGSSQSDRTNTHLRKQFWPGVFQLPLQLRCFVSLVTRNTVVRCFFFRGKYDNLITFLLLLFAAGLLIFVRNAHKHRWKLAQFFSSLFVIDFPFANTGKLPTISALLVHLGTTAASTCEVGNSKVKPTWMI